MLPSRKHTPITISSIIRKKMRKKTAWVTISPIPHKTTKNKVSTLPIAMEKLSRTLLK